MRQCFGLPQTPTVARCEATGFLCSHCRLTCGFCAGPSCHDKLPVAECHARVMLRGRNGTMYALPADFCRARQAASSPDASSWTAHPLDGLHHARNGARSLTAAEMRLALRGRRILFLGDSNTRYQERTLARANARRTQLSQAATDDHRPNLRST